MTQPTVTQHVQYLERQYGVPLVEYHGKSVMLTPKGEQLYHFIMTMEADSERVRQILKEPIEEKRHIKFGATLTIGQYIMPQIMAKYFTQHPNVQITMPVENTKRLLQRLNDGEIEFAIIEGYFDKHIYGHALLSYERFLAVCAPGHPLLQRTYKLDELCRYPLVTREKGSGTRDIFEHILNEHYLSIDDYEQILELGSFQVIKDLVRQGIGFTCAYEPVVKEEIEKGILKEISIEKFSTEREFNFVYLKDSIFEEEYLQFYQFCMEHLKES
ncbi:MAG: LysR family transcriptional regulator [Acutalibacteraceae bacterium]